LRIHQPHTHRPGAALSALATALFGGMPVVEAQVPPTFNDVPFAVVPMDAGGTVTLLMDIYLPVAGSTPRPLLLWIHGGGWTGGSHNGPPSYAVQMVTHGFAVASTGYRLSGEAVFPAQIHDVKGAVRFLRANAATYNLDPTRFACWGSSAGGHLSALLAMSPGVAELEGTSGGNPAVSSAVQACVDYYGPTDILNMNPDVTTPPGSTIDHDAPDSPESRLVGWDQPGQGIGDIRANLANPAAPYPALVLLCSQVNPVTWVDATDPPTFIAHGTADTLVPLMQSTRLDAALGAAGVPRQYTQVAGAGHGGFPADTQLAAQAFLLDRLTSPRLAGDLNCDGSVDPGDIPPFVLRLLSFPAYLNQHPGCNPLNGDLRPDGAVDSRDIPGFLDLMGV
jgi:acetyl esterase/lipase